MQDTTPAQLRSAAAASLKTPGAKRLKLLRQLEEVENELRPLVVEAWRHEVTYRDIRDATGIVANTVRLWVNKAGAER
ncbi:hypothetical protein [Streptomyces sp. NPDC012510]|uniref:hypothetical protein n=1 Tax=Streptomyces sp. NPDC012510 TaxID=3364838 RepID=UPI0036E80BCD